MVLKPTHLFFVVVVFSNWRPYHCFKIAATGIEMETFSECFVLQILYFSLFCFEFPQGFLVNLGWPADYTRQARGTMQLSMNTSSKATKDEHKLQLSFGYAFNNHNNLRWLSHKVTKDYSIICLFYPTIILCVILTFLY